MRWPGAVLLYLIFIWFYGYFCLLPARLLGRDVGLSPEACVAQTEMIRLADSDELLVASLGSLDKWTWPSDSGQQRVMQSLGRPEWEQRGDGAHWSSKTGFWGKVGWKTDLYELTAVGQHFFGTMLTGSREWWWKISNFSKGKLC